MFHRQRAGKVWTEPDQHWGKGPSMWCNTTLEHTLNSPSTITLPIHINTKTSHVRTLLVKGCPCDQGRWKSSSYRQSWWKGRETGSPTPPQGQCRTSTVAPASKECTLAPSGVLAAAHLATLGWSWVVWLGAASSTPPGTATHLKMTFSVVA